MAVVEYYIHMKEYDRSSAVNYALMWWNSRNPRFFNFDNIGGDCTNFVSQCLLAGGALMNYNKNFGWFYNSVSDRSPSWTSVDFFEKFLLNNKSKGPVARLCGVDELEIGDIIQIRQRERFNHSLFVTKIVNGDIFVTTHSNDSVNREFSSYYVLEKRCFKILGILT